jgi:hypothetical protein
LVEESALIEAGIRDHVVVSVPHTTSQQSVEELVTRLGDTLGKPVIFVTHNVQFLRVRKLTGSEAAKVTKRAQHVEAAIKAEAKAGAGIGPSETEGVGGGDSGSGGDGDRPGVCIGGGGGAPSGEGGDTSESGVPRDTPESLARIGDKDTEGEEEAENES